MHHTFRVDPAVGSENERKKRLTNLNAPKTDVRYGERTLSRMKDFCVALPLRDVSDPFLDAVLDSTFSKITPFISAKAR